MSQNLSAGILSIVADGEIFNARGDFEYSTAQTEIENQAGVDRHIFEQHTPMVPYIAGNISDSGDLDTANLSGRRFDSVQLQLLNGKKITLNKAVQVSRSVVNAQTGIIPVRFEGTTTPDEDLAS